MKPLNEEQRQLVILAIAKLSHSRPGFEPMLREIAERYEGVAMYDEAVALGPDRPLISRSDSVVVVPPNRPSLVCSTCHASASMTVDGRCPKCNRAYKATINYCKACDRFAPLVDGECPDCRH